MEKRLFTQNDLEARCLRPLRTDLVLYLLCAALCLFFGILFADVFPDTPLLRFAFFAAALLFAVLAALAFLKVRAVRTGRFTAAVGTVLKKHEKGVCDAGANYLVFTFGEASLRQITFSALTVEEFRAAEKDRTYYVFMLGGPRPAVLCAVPTEAYSLAPALEEKRIH